MFYILKIYLKYFEDKKEGGNLPNLIKLETRQLSSRLPPIFNNIYIWCLPSSATSWSAKRNTIFWLSIPNLLYRVFKSSRKLVSLYPRESVMLKIWHSAAKLARRHKLCLPLPPTPTNRPWPWSIRIMRWIRVKCSNASLNRTKFIGIFLSLYSSNNWKLKTQTLK